MKEVMAGRRSIWSDACLSKSRGIATVPRIKKIRALGSEFQEMWKDNERYMLDFCRISTKKKQTGFCPWGWVPAQFPIHFVPYTNWLALLLTDSGSTRRCHQTWLAWTSPSKRRFIAGKMSIATFDCRRCSTIAKGDLIFLFFFAGTMKMLTIPTQALQNSLAKLSV